ncbi:hypothetical protein J5N97_007197 [Dioscorea zingiberensis]|uniref:COBRA C-terminal domain-containing protein n=1 Tax=Dioscorea zingiberensis TaxID=325984 RepID=A0A9D5DBG9_9LILI|nr:hypothetical protein J5N97_007197 [Dioscorea zingiberensis]
MQWTPDGYVAVVNISNEQEFRPVAEPGWKLSWTWGRREVIWSMVGAQALLQGDCSHFVGNIPHSCERRPTIVDLLPGVPFNDQVAGCCRDGVLAPKAFGDPDRSTAGFQLSVGLAGTTNRTVRLPTNFTFEVERGGYACGAVKVVRPTRFLSPDGRRVTQALMTWKVVCTYSAFLAKKTPACCVSLSSADHRLSSGCKDCACSCRSASAACTRKGSAGKPSRLSSAVKCTNHMCPVQINWHLKSQSKDNWGARVSITNYNHRSEISNWATLLHLPQSNHLMKITQANHKPLLMSIGGWEMFWGIKKYNRVINKEGIRGSTVNWEVIYSHKNVSSHNGTVGAPYIPLAIYFNGDACSMPAKSTFLKV